MSPGRGFKKKPKKRASLTPGRRQELKTAIGRLISKHGRGVFNAHDVLRELFPRYNTNNPDHIHWVRIVAREEFKLVFPKMGLVTTKKPAPQKRFKITGAMGKAIENALRDQWERDRSSIRVRALMTEIVSDKAFEGVNYKLLEIAIKERYNAGNGFITNPKNKKK